MQQLSYQPSRKAALACPLLAGQLSAKKTCQDFQYTNLFWEADYRAAKCPGAEGGEIWGAGCGLNTGTRQSTMEILKVLWLKWATRQGEGGESSHAYESKVRTESQLHAGVKPR